MDNKAANLQYTMFLHTKNHYRFKMIPFYAKIVVLRCSTAGINRAGYMSARAIRNDVSNGRKLYKDHQEALPNVKFVIWVWIMVKLMV